MLVWFLGFWSLVIQGSCTLSNCWIFRFAFGNQLEFFSQLKIHTQTSFQGWSWGCLLDVRFCKCLWLVMDGEPPTHISPGPIFWWVVSHTCHIVRVSERRVSTTHVAKFLPCWVRSPERPLLTGHLLSSIVPYHHWKQPLPPPSMPGLFLSMVFIIIYPAMHWFLNLTFLWNVIPFRLCFCDYPVSHSARPSAWYMDGAWDIPVDAWVDFCQTPGHSSCHPISGNTGLTGV